jgi:hypothetical protein
VYVLLKSETLTSVLGSEKVDDSDQLSHTKKVKYVYKQHTANDTMQTGTLDGMAI